MLFTDASLEFLMKTVADELNDDEENQLDQFRIRARGDCGENLVMQSLHARTYPPHRQHKISDNQQLALKAKSNTILEINLSLRPALAASVSYFA